MRRAQNMQPELERPMVLLNSSTKLPKLDALARSNILQLIKDVRPVTPDGQYVSTDHPLLSSSALQTYSDLFFTRFNATYPLIHLASFDPSSVDTLLLLSILLIGATYGEKDAHQLSVCSETTRLSLKADVIAGVHTRRITTTDICTQ